jgi:GH18 family chitinase
LNEGTDVSRPAEVREIGDGVYEIVHPVDYDASDEEWEFPPGSRVRISKRTDSDGRDYLIAVAEMDRP